MSNRKNLFFDQKNSETLIDLCFLVNGLRHQLVKQKIADFRKLLECDSLIQKKIDHLISSQSEKEYTRNMKEGKANVRGLLEICKSTQAHHLLDQEKLKVDLLKIESLLNKLST
ncbi:hypothetical protein [Zunongwangia pacifica]|uniref:Uncharacterized protein n=1 Tax=Zunongwangia pacifica TaxID=2911062 RepID=A0A9X1ZSX7_9FLAO|nr:hypothetical protein [Zunongwangia pacifica]MCL6220462.1 hypothetical protein [Zunongwangia pacifica]